MTPNSPDREPEVFNYDGVRPPQWRDGDRIWRRVDVTVTILGQTLEEERLFVASVNVSDCFKIYWGSGFDEVERVASHGRKLLHQQALGELLFADLLTSGLTLHYEYRAPTQDELEDRWRKDYRAEFEGWDWPSIRANVESNAMYLDESDAYLGQSYLGSCLSLTPSGKYYTPWANSNVTEKEALKDEIWYEVLDAVAAEHGLYIGSGEGDATDIFADALVLEVGDHVKTLTPLVVEDLPNGKFDHRTTKHHPEGTVTTIERFDKGDGEIIVEIDGDEFFLTYDQVEKIEVEKGSADVQNA